MARLIDADRALEIVRDQGIAHPNAYHLTNYATLILQEAPTIEAKPVVHGEWVITEDDWHSLTLMKCSECGEEWCFEFDETDFPNYNYCPACGADMRERKET
jgi:hypothetical protein